MYGSRMKRLAGLLGQCAALALMTAACATTGGGGAAPTAAAGDWPTLGHDPGGSRFSRLAQIDTSNVGRLREAWVYHMRKPADPASGGGFGEGGPPGGGPSQPGGAPPEAGGAQPGAPVAGGGGGNQRAQGGFSASESIPLVVDGIMYLATPYARIVALDLTARRELWSFDIPARDQASTRGIEYYKGDGTTPPSLIFGGRSGKLYSIRAADGRPNVGFGDNGVVNLKTPEVMVTGMERGYTLPSPPIVYKNLVITGSGTGEAIGGPVGDVRAWDARTGKLVWTFKSRPPPGDPNHGTWGGDSDVSRSGVNVWGLMTVDEGRGIVYMPFGAPANDRVGVDRPGNNLYSSSIVAADANTGKYLWHFQLTHHDIWDIDTAAPPTLLEVTQNGRAIPAVALTNKAGNLFIMDRVTGEPIFGVEERPVPQSDVPGERTSPTQPFPLKPEPLSRNTLTRAELAKVTPELEAFCRKLVDDNNMLLGGPYLPTALNRATVNFPGTLGGVNWAGGTFDPANGLYVVNVLNFGQIQTIVPTPGQGIGFANRGQVAGRFWQQDTRLPCTDPPWGQLVAVNVSTGEVAWRSTLGVSDNLPADRRNTGRPSLGGPISTAGGLTFIAATDDSRFRAFETRTGRELWTVVLPGSAHTVPVTFADKTGKQYVAITATGGAGFLGTPVTGDSVVFYALP